MLFGNHLKGLRGDMDKLRLRSDRDCKEISSAHIQKFQYVSMFAARLWGYGANNVTDYTLYGAYCVV